MKNNRGLFRSIMEIEKRPKKRRRDRREVYAEYEEAAEYPDEAAYEETVAYPDETAYEEDAAYSDETVYEETVSYEEETADDIPVPEILESDYNPFEDEATARPSLMGFLLGREAKGSAHAKRARVRRETPRTKKKKASPLAWFTGMTAYEKVTLAAGLMIVLLAISIGTVYVQARGVDKQVASFAELGTELDGVDTIGARGLLAVSDAQTAKRLAAEEAALLTAAEASTEEVVEEDDSVTVIMTLTTVQSDIKAKFINYDTNRRISGVPFQVRMVSPDGKETTIDDHDKDGIIYRSELPAGTYKVSMLALPETYSKYIISTEVLSIKVKDTIEYKGIDIVDEIKSESEVNVAAEDQQKQDTPQEGALSDTVEWVESTKREVSAGTTNAVTQGNTEYQKIDKSTIPNPFDTSRLDRVDGTFLKLSESSSEGGSQAVDLQLGSSSVTMNKGDSRAVDITVTPSDGLSEVSVRSDNTDVVNAYKEGSTVRISGMGAGSTTISVSYQGITRTISVTVEDPTPDYQISLGEAAVSVETGETKTVSVSVNREGGSPSLRASSGNANVATAEMDGSTLRITGRGEGSTNVYVSYAGTEAAVQVTVRAVEKASINVTPDTVSIRVGEYANLAASVEGVSDKSVNWSVTSGLDIVRVDENGKVTALKEGTATVRGTSRADGSLFDETKVTVSQNAELLKEQLKDKDGHDVYLKKGDSYVLATKADYADNSEFYILTATSKAYLYTGWQTLEGKTYYFDKNGAKVTGEQVINGAKYTFNSDGSLTASSGNLGIDVSKWNGSIDWNAVRNSGVSYVIIRCGYRGMDTGALIEDPRFRANIQGATAAGLKVGVYFFTQAVNEVEAVEEASMVISLCRGYHLTYPIFLDVESGGRANGISVDMRTKVCKAFCATVSNAGYKAGIYANKTWFNSYINTPQLTGYKLWLAQYAAAPSYTRTRYDMWQYSSKGRISGISGNVDMNISYLGY